MKKIDQTKGMSHRVSQKTRESMSAAEGRRRGKKGGRAEGGGEGQRRERVEWGRAGAQRLKFLERASRGGKIGRQKHI